MYIYYLAQFKFDLVNTYVLIRKFTWLIISFPHVLSLDSQLWLQTLAVYESLLISFTVVQCGNWYKENWVVYTGFCNPQSSDW